MTARTEGTALRIWRGEVLPEWIDYNGHMNEGFYGMVFAMASEQYLLRIGFNHHYRIATGGSFYTVETHIVFIDELSKGDPLVVDTTVAGADRKRVHLFHELRLANEPPGGSMAATQESMMLHVDTGIGRVTEMSDKLYSVLQLDLQSHACLLASDAIGRAIKAVPG